MNDRPALACDDHIVVGALMGGVVGGGVTAIVLAFNGFFPSLCGGVGGMFAGAGVGALLGWVSYLVRSWLRRRHDEKTRREG